jgi:hypothetical protein
MPVSVFSTSRKNNPPVNRGINLVPTDLKESPRNRTVKKFLSATSSLLLVLYTLVLAGLFGFSFFLNGQAKQLEATNSILVNDVKKLQDKEELLLTLKNRASLARKIYAENPGSTELFDKVIALVPPDVSLVGAETKETSIVITASSANPLSIQKFLSSIEQAKINNVMVQTLTSALGAYTVAVSVQ